MAQTKHFQQVKIDKLLHTDTENKNQTHESTEKLVEDVWRLNDDNDPRWLVITELVAERKILGVMLRLSNILENVYGKVLLKELWNSIKRSKGRSRS